MLLVVMAVAVNGYRLAGVLAALSAAVWFDFFLTQPYGRFTITWRTDIERTVLLLVIGVVVTEISVVGRRQHAAASRRAGYVDGICGAAHTVAAEGSPSAAIDQVAGRLAQLLLLWPCRFRYSVAGLGQPARLHTTGWSARPAGRGMRTLTGSPLVLAWSCCQKRGGIFRGRVLPPFVGAHPAHEQRLPAVAFAGQAGAALGVSRPVEEA
jgi:hypothetical protein